MPNMAQNTYLANQLDGIEMSDFDGQGGFWAKAAQLGIPEHQINQLIAGFTRFADPNTGAPTSGFTDADLGYTFTAPAYTSVTAAPAAGTTAAAPTAGATGTAVSSADGAPSETARMLGGMTGGNSPTAGAPNRSSARLVR